MCSLWLEITRASVVILTLSLQVAPGGLVTSGGLTVAVRPDGQAADIYISDALIRPARPGIIRVSHLTVHRGEFAASPVAEVEVRGRFSCFMQ